MRPTFSLVSGQFFFLGGGAPIYSTYFESGFMLFEGTDMATECGDEMKGEGKRERIFGFQS
jgi:hypothetical protein